RRLKAGEPRATMPRFIGLQARNDMLSTTAEYALRIAVALTEAEGRALTSRELAAITNVPANYCVKVVQWLFRRKLVTGQRGRGGGFRLACDPETTTLLDVVDAI